MKNILTRILCVLLAICLMVSLAACSNNNSASQTAANDEVAASEDIVSTKFNKIGVLCSPLSWGEENYRMLQKYTEEYGDRIIVNTMPEDGDTQAIVSMMTQMANDPEVGAIVVNECCLGTIAGIKAVKSINPNILVLGVQIGDEPIEISEVIDMACLPAFEELGAACADAAYAAGLQYVVFETAADYLGSTATQKRLSGLTERCAEYGIEVITNVLPNQNETSNRPALVQAAKEDISNKINQYGDAVGFFPNSSFIYVPMIAQMVELKAGYLVGLADPGPFGPAYCDAFGIVAPDDHILDAKWTNEAINAAVIEAGMEGHFANWSFAFLSSFMAASIEYALEYVDGKVGKNDVDKWMQLYMDVNSITTEDFSYTSFHSEDGTAYDNILMISGVFRYYGEAIK